MNVGLQLGASNSRRSPSPFGGWARSNSPLSSSSQSSSRSSTSDMPPAASSQSDFAPSDHDTQAFRRPRANNGSLAVLPPPASHRSSLLAMGQSYSKPDTIVGHVSGSAQIAQRGLAAAAATGGKLKRAFGGGRKKTKSEDTTKVLSAGHHHKSAASSASIHIPARSRTSAESQHSANSPGGSKLSLRLAAQVFGGRRSTSSSSPSEAATDTPPPVPPKSSPAAPAVSLSPPLPRRREQRSSLITMTPAISSAVSYSMSLNDDTASATLKKVQSREKDPAADKETWRKSDSTIGHSTIRPGALAQPRASRPVSTAESVQSTHTILANKRMSALIDDADWAMPEEDDLASDEPIMVTAKSSPTPSMRELHRRSTSMSVRATQPTIVLASSPSDSAVNDLYGSMRGYPGIHTSYHDVPRITTTAASGFISPSNYGSQPAGNHIRGKLEAWNANSQYPPPPPRIAPSPPPRFTASPKPPSSNSFRQTAISMSNGLAPAAGLAKRAVEKMGRAWGGLSASSSSNSGYASSSSSGGAPPTAWAEHGLNLRRTSSSQSRPSFYQSNSSKGKNRRTPDAPSGAWSVSSSVTSSSVSDSEGPSGPDLGHMVRSPLRQKGGVVFGKELRIVVRHTAIKFTGVGDAEGTVTKDNLAPLEARQLPAIVARCAQHILLWGVQEEGLFRVSGRPSHVSKLRTEFDKGADYDMRGCSPGEIDPHAVAGVFKAFLREMPEPVLTHTMIPYFEEALSQEADVNSLQSNGSSEVKRTGAGPRGPGLPSNPRDTGLRKPPSLSTLSMPNFSGARPPSQPLKNALRALIHQLPAENRDLLRTVTELINATASEHKSTKMPLNNLLLIFCPSLSMNPPMLRALCEADDIWDLPSSTVEKEEEDVQDQVAAEDSDLDAGRLADTEEESISSSRPSIDESLSGDMYRPPSRQFDQGRTSYDSEDGNSRSRNQLFGPRHTNAPAAIFGDMHANGGDNSMFPPPLSSSDSLTSPSGSSAVSSIDQSPPLQTDKIVGWDKDKTTDVSEPSDSSFITAPMPVIGGIQFPTFEDGSSSPGLSSKRSMPSLTNSPAGSDIVQTSTAASPRKRMKRPSLTLLFSKRSASSLTSARPVISGPISQHPPRAVSDSATTTPVSVTSRTSQFILDTPIDDSPFKLGMGLDSTSPVEPMQRENEALLAIPTESPSKSTYLTSRFPIDEDRLDEPSGSPASPSTPVSEAGPSHLRSRPTRGRAPTSSNHLGILDDNEEEDKEDWTRSVLLAADPNGWTLS